MGDQLEFNILIVDDEKSNLDVLNNILKSEHNIFVAKSGNAALKRVTEDAPDLILLDIIMPDMNGFEVLAKLKASPDTRDIPVICITGLSNTEDEEKGFTLGVVDYITKPFRSSIVRARVNSQLKIIGQMRKIERFGMIDALTDLPNRRNFDNQINIEWGRALRERTPISILMMDIDKFKEYNDTYGHPQGDALLKGISKVFVSTLKRTTDLVFRWGGEEFAVVLPNTDEQQACRVAEMIRESVERAVIPFCDGTPPPRNQTISIGVAGCIPSGDISISDFISRADKALYTAKNIGRNRVCL